MSKKDASYLIIPFFGKIFHALVLVSSMWFGGSIKLLALCPQKSLFCDDISPEPKWFVMDLLEDRQHL